jgi:hypothetical protein
MYKGYERVLSRGVLCKAVLLANPYFQQQLMMTILAGQTRNPTHKILSGI